MSDRVIKRIALLQEYRNRPWEMKPMISEVASKGYHAAAFSVRIGEEEFFAELAQEAQLHDLEVMAFTGYMKYQEPYLKDHPDQKLRLSTEADVVDQDRLAINWGCPWNPDFLQRYLTFLETLGKIANLTEVWVNDEAYLGFGVNRIACYCQTCQKAWRDEFDEEMPKPPFDDRDVKQRFFDWRFRRWNHVHATMKQALNENHRVRAVFLTVPGSCLELNPWHSSIDFSSMVQSIDGVMTDPYYTFHWANEWFRPIEVYLSEHCRYLRGVCGKGKVAEVCTQGFSQANFLRPLDQRDGWWAGIIPAALGLDGITSYTYPLQKISPMQETYEKSFELHSYFQQTRPVDFVALVDSLETQCYDVDSPGGPDCWRSLRLMPLAETMRHNGLPYTYLPSRQLEAENLLRWPVIVLPGVSCLSNSAKKRLRDYVKSGGVLIACGPAGTLDEVGKDADSSFLHELFGIEIVASFDEFAEFAACGDQPAFSSLPWPDETIGKLWGGILHPLLGLNHADKTTVHNTTDILATFDESNEFVADSAAITSREYGDGRAVYIAGIPSRTYVRPQFARPARNFAGRVIGQLLTQLAGDKLPLRAKGFPPMVPMDEVRPLEPRSLPTAEFMPCVSDDLYLVTIPSYFKEPMKFQIEADIPAGKQCKQVRELITDRTISQFRQSDKSIEIDVELSFEDCLAVFAISWEQK